MANGPGEVALGAVRIREAGVDHGRVAIALRRERELQEPCLLEDGEAAIGVALPGIGRAHHVVGLDNETASFAQGGNEYSQGPFGVGDAGAVIALHQVEDGQVHVGRADVRVGLAESRHLEGQRLPVEA